MKGSMLVRVSVCCTLSLTAHCLTLADQERQYVQVRIDAPQSDVHRYEPMQWSAVLVKGVNPRDEDVELMVAAGFRDDNKLQYARKFWVPAKTERRAWLPVQVPGLPTGYETLPIMYSVLDTSSSREVFQRQAGELLRAKALLIVDYDTIKTAVMLPRAGIANQAPAYKLEHHTYKTIVSSRKASHQSTAVMDLTGDFLPATPRALDSLDQLVLVTDRIVDDSAGIEAVRDWVQRGGRLWIMLDRVHADTVSTLLGDSVSHVTVGRVELSDFTITDLTRPQNAERESRWQSEMPVEFVRVLTDSVDIHCTIDGWPAAFWQPFGDGEVLFTTLGARGWRFDPDFRTDHDVVKGLDTLADRLYQERVEGNLAEEDVKSMLHEQIGYSIPSRSLIIFVLGFNFAGILGVGIWLCRQHQLERLAWVVPLITVVTTGALVLLGTLNSQSVPSMMAAVQLVRADPSAPQANVSGLAAIYAQNSAELALESDELGLTIPEHDESSPKIKRLVYDDAGTSRWVNVEVGTASVQFVKYNRITRLDSPVRARAHFGENGLEGQLEDGGTALSDLVIVAPPAPSLAVTQEEDGSFRSGTSRVLNPHQYLADTLLSDKQRRRITVFRRLLDPADEMSFPQSPTLFGWSDSLPLSVSMPEHFKVSGTSLVAVPLHIDSTPRGARFLVPATFIPIESLLGRQGRSSVFNARTGIWHEVSTATTTHLRFVIPEQVRPCRLQRAVLTFKINAPARKVEINYQHGDETLVYSSLESPSGVYTLSIDNPQVLTLDADGGLRFGFVVSLTQKQRRLAAALQAIANETAAMGQEVDPSEDVDFDNSPVRQMDIDNATWKIDYLRMDVIGEKL